MKITLSPDKTKLTITAGPAERGYIAYLESPDADVTLFGMFDALLSNSEYQWIKPHETGDLTSAPMLGILGEEDVFTKKDSTIPHRITGPGLFRPILGRWAFMDYQVKSVLGTLRDEGEAVFIGGMFG